MKTLSFILTIFLLLNIFVGCEEDVIIPVEPPVVIDPVVKGEAYALPTSIVAGETTTITYTGSKDVTSVTINGTTVSATAGSKSYALTSTTTFVVKFVGPNNITDEKSFTVNVTEPPVVVPTKLDTMTNLICLAPWKTIKVEMENKNRDGWEELTMSDLEARSLWTLKKDGSCIISDPLGEQYPLNGLWNFTNDLKGLTHGGRTDEIIVFSKEKIVLRYWIQKLDPTTDQWVNYCQGQRTYGH